MNNNYLIIPVSEIEITDDNQMILTEGDGNIEAIKLLDVKQL